MTWTDEELAEHQHDNLVDAREVRASGNSEVHQGVALAADRLAELYRLARLGLHAQGVFLRWQRTELSDIEAIVSLPAHPAWTR